MMHMATAENPRDNNKETYSITHLKVIGGWVCVKSGKYEEWKE
jgi:hypothetical protein